MDLKELTLVNPQINWYYRAKLHAILRLITKHSIHPARIIDVGAGSGFFGKSIKHKYPNSSLECIDTNYELNSIDIDGTVYKKSSKGVVGDTYIFIDVLEHVDDDLGLVNEYIKNAASGANVIITVPAFMSLWSGHDVFLEHKRRYTKKELIKLCSELGLHELESGYLFSSIFPLAYLIRKTDRQKTKSSMKELSQIVNFLLRCICSIEHHFFRNPFFGLSTYLVARK